jgi:lycopene beta-cyclase
MNDFAYIITGAGAAGLSLVYHFGQTDLAQQRVLLIDQSPKTRNDRTWCFWESGDGVFEPVVFRSWDHLWFYGEQQAERLKIAPYRYKMIQGGDFYRFVNDWVATQPNITRLYDTVERVEEAAGGVTIWVDGQPYHGRWAFNSIYRPEPQRPGYHSWLQHFKGWVITTPKAAFDPGAAIFMDFRIDQGADVRFGYVLPYDERTALIEYTFFSSELVAQEVYDAGLKQYINEYLGIDSYAIQHVEFGVIPMTDIPFARRPSPHVMNIGTAGGMTKASTGYTFQRIQKQSRRIVESLLTTGQPFYPESLLKRHALMDSVLLNVLDSGRESGKAFFHRLFSKNSPQRVLRFLDEETSLWEDLALMSTVNVPAFMVATLDVASQRVWRLKDDISEREGKHPRTPRHLNRPT